MKHFKDIYNMIDVVSNRLLHDDYNKLSTDDKDIVIQEMILHKLINKYETYTKRKWKRSRYD
jgi:hypothetical protein